MKPKYKLILTTISFLSLFLFNVSALSQSQPIQIDAFDIEDFVITSDSQYIVFNAFDPNFNNIRRFSVKINGNTQPALIIDGISEDALRVDPDDNRVYSFIDEFDPISLGFSAVLSSSIDGTSSVILSNGNSENLSSRTFSRFSNVFNEGTNLYLFTIEGGGIYSIPADGSGPATLLSNNLTNFDEVVSFRISRDRQTVVYSARIDATSNHQIYSVPVNGSSSPIFLGELADSTDVDGAFVFSQDNTRVVFIAETFEDDNTQTLQLNSVKIDGTSNITPLSDPLNSFDNPDIDYRITNENIVLFSTQDFANGFSQLFSVLIDGSEDPILLDTGLNIGRFTSVTDGEYVVYNIENPQTFDPPVNGVTSISNNENIVITRIDGSSEPQVLIDKNDETQLIRSVGNFQLTDDENFTYFISNSEAPLTSGPFFGSDFHLFRSTNSGNFSTQRISIDSASVTSFQLNEDQTHIFYIAESSGSAGLNELYKAELDGSNPIKISLPEHGDVFSFEVSNDNNYVVYEAFEIGTSLTKLYTTKLDLDKTSNSLCFPIKGKNDNFVTICL